MHALFSKKSVHLNLMFLFVRTFLQRYAAFSATAELRFFHQFQCQQMT